jgi:hypothetical protein
MPLRAGFDVDGVLADFRTAFEREARHHLNDPLDPDRAESDSLSNHELKRIWARIMRTPNWWTSVKPFEPDQIRRLYGLVRSHRWEVVFMTKRPITAGEPVQFQTQHWLEQQGFHYPAVVTVPGSRGELVNALRLDVIVDDQLFNCVDVVTGSHTKALLLAREGAAELEKQALERGIGVVHSLEEALDAMQALDQMQVERKGRLQRLSEWFVPGTPDGISSTPDPTRVTLADPGSGQDD